MVNDDDHKHSERAARLSRTAVFSGGAEEALRDLAEAAAPRTLAKGELLWRIGERPDAVALLLSGRLHVERTTADGQRMILRVLGPDALVGLSTLRGQPHTADLVAGEETELLLLSAQSLRTVLAKKPEIALAALGHLGELLGRLTDEVEELRFASLEERLLQRIARLGEGRTEIHITHEELADQAGATRANVSRALKRLERRGLLRCGRVRIEILNGGHG